MAFLFLISVLSCFNFLEYFANPNPMEKLSVQQAELRTRGKDINDSDWKQKFHFDDIDLQRFKVSDWFEVGVIMKAIIWLGLLVLLQLSRSRVSSRQKSLCSSHISTF